ncbi:uncharacterized protein [Branchiostoma lanceolatum]|uniref:uncharacterized protein n=1 Tax=Branchiostoma lanceolatum TaxID=7740 RepID=UPI003452C891
MSGCKARVYDQNSPVYDWDGESGRITLSVTDKEPGDGTTVGESGNGVDVGLAVGLSVAAVVIIALLAVIVWKIRNRLPPIQGPPITNGNGVSAVISGGTTGTGGGSVEGSGTDPENRPLTNGDIPMGPIPADEVHVENEDSEDGSGPSGPPTGEFGVEHEGPPVRPGDNAEPDLTPAADEGPGTGVSTQDGSTDQPHTQPSNGLDGTLPYPVVVSTGAGPPTQPESSNNTSSMWVDVFETVGRNLRANNRKPLARALGLTEIDISAIEEDHDRNAKEKLHQVLVLWRERNPLASPGTLAAALRSREFNLAARRVDECWMRHDQR